MNENNPQPPESDHSKAVVAAGWTAGLAALFLTGMLTANPAWPVAFGAAAIAAMVATVCYFMLKK
jgi:dipeptide/tripeptide permease